MPATFLDDMVFPVAVSRGTAGGPDWPAEIVELASGAEERNTAIAVPRRNYDAKFAVRTQAELYEVLKLYYIARGRLYGFRMRDWSDYRSGAPHVAPAFDDQALGTGDGIADTFLLTKTYAIGARSFSRRVTRPTATLLVGIDGTPVTTGFTVDYTMGKVVFDDPPADQAALTWGGEFHVPVRFDCALDQISHTSAAIGDIPSILLKELRE